MSISSTTNGEITCTSQYHHKRDYMYMHQPLLYTKKIAVSSTQPYQSPKLVRLRHICLYTNTLQFLRFKSNILPSITAYMYHFNLLMMRNKSDGKRIWDDDYDFYHDIKYNNTQVTDLHFFSDYQNRWLPVSRWRLLWLPSNRSTRGTPHVFHIL